ncbi:MAG: META domain-containing protein [Steroidobacteraceae bacterium]|nr:META domain-containing protein [Steroidobacteraceae bacterium]
MSILVRASIGLVTCCALLVPLDAATAAPDTGSLDGSAWVLTAVAGRQVPGGATVTLQFASGRLSGSDGCNRFAGGYSTTGSAFEASPQLATTAMACPEGVETEARAFIAALAAAKGYQIDGARLLLLSSDGTTLVSLAAQSLLIEGTSWNATGINNGRQAVQSILNGTIVTLSFGADGDASGSGGCNRYSGRYEASGSSISIGGITVTAMNCASPEGVMEQEQAYLKALATAKSVRFEGDRLELRTEDGALAASFMRAAGG